MTRWLGFVLVILLGLTAGLYYGWVINPVRYVDTIPSSLRIDYKSDYVLMTAEVYQAEKDLSLAVRRLGFIGSENPLATVQDAILFATQKGYPDADLTQMRGLENAVKTWNPSLNQTTP